MYFSMEPMPFESGKSRKRCRKWLLRVQVGVYPSGKPRYETKRFDGTYTQAKEEQDKLEASAITPSQARRTFADLAEEWKQSRIGNVSTRRQASDKYHVDNMNLHLGSTPVEQITPSMIREMYKKFQEGQSVSKKPLSNTYIRDMATTLHGIFEWYSEMALEEGRMVVNPCRLSSAPGRDTEEKDSIRAKDMSRLIEKLDPKEPVPFALRVIMRTGIRRGEACALKVGDVDFVHNIICVYEGTDLDGTLKETKTLAGKRELPLPESVAKDVIVRMEQIRVDLEKRGLSMTPETSLVCNEEGKRYRPDSVTKWWIRNRGRLGHKGLTIHELRHSYLSEMARRKTEPKVLQKLAGHADFSTTMNIYTHVDMEDKSSAVENMDW